MQKTFKLALLGIILAGQVQSSQAFISGEGIFAAGFSTGLIAGTIGTLAIQKSYSWAKNETGTKKYLGSTVLVGSAFGLVFLAGRLSK